MLLLTSTQSPGNANLPVFNPTTLQQQVYALLTASGNNALWLEGDSSIQQSSDGYVGSLAGYQSGTTLTITTAPASSAPLATGQLIQLTGGSAQYLVSGSGTSWVTSVSQTVGSSGSPVTGTNTQQGSLTQWVDKVAGRIVAPLATGGTKPAVILPKGALDGSYPTRRALRSNFLSVTADNRLGLTDGGAQVFGTSFTVATVFRVPVAPANGGTEVSITPAATAGVSNKLDTGYALIGVSSTGGPRLTLGVTSLENGASPAMQDGNWHYRVTGIDNATGAWFDRVDGVAAGSGTTSDRLTNLDLVLCGGGATSAVQRFTGDTGAAFACPYSLGLAANATALATLESYLSLIKTQMSA